MTNRTIDAAQTLDDLHDFYDGLAVTYSGNSNTVGSRYPEGSRGARHAAARTALYDDAIAAAALVKQLEVINDRLIVERRNLR